MESVIKRFAIVGLLGAALLLWPGTTPAGDRHRSSRAQRAAPGQEVLNGTTYCDGTVYTDEQEATISVGSWFSATSGITQDLSGSGRSTRDVPEDLDALAESCRVYIDRITSRMPSACAVGPVNRQRGEFGNGASVSSRVDFSCQGTRDAVIGVIGKLSRAALSTRIP